MPHSRSAVTDMVNAAELALSYVEGIEEAAFLGDQEKQDAVVRRLEILGEAAGRVEESIQERFGDIPWREAIGIRNRVIHGYESVDAKIVWDTIQNDLPPLIGQLKVMLTQKDW